MGTCTGGRGKLGRTGRYDLLKGQVNHDRLIACARESSAKGMTTLSLPEHQRFVRGHVFFVGIASIRDSLNDGQ
jgi:hypothetical protein